MSATSRNFKANSENGLIIYPGGLPWMTRSRECSDEERQQSGNREAAQQNRPVTRVETQKPTVVREPESGGKPQHGVNPMICDGVTQVRHGDRILACQMSFGCCTAATVVHKLHLADMVNVC